MFRLLFQGGSIAFLVFLYKTKGHFLWKKEITKKNKSNDKIWKIINSNKIFQNIFNKYGDNSYLSENESKLYWDRTFRYYEIEGRIKEWIKTLKPFYIN